MLPPVISPKTMIGYSDVSFIGNLLSLRYPNFRFVMGANAYEPELMTHLSGKNLDNPSLSSDYALTLEIAKGRCPAPVTVKCKGNASSPIRGNLFPINLSLAESMGCIKDIELPTNSVLFIEDINEDVYRILRMIDSIALAGFLSTIEAVVLGDFGNSLNASGEAADPEILANLIAKRTGLPVFLLPNFGHGARRFPLVAGSMVTIDHAAENDWLVTITFSKQNAEPSRENTPSPCYTADKQGSLFLGKYHPKQTSIHFLGIGGTGMAAVAGLAKKSGFGITGSDGPIYPPMSGVIAALEVTPFVGYKATNIDEASPDVVVLANAISRIDASLRRNEEFEALLNRHLPVLSFPGFLRQAFLTRTLNIVVAGTHGKTTTTSCISQSLRHLGLDPSFVIGGAPKNFDNGFHLGQSPIFVLEGDEYDTALFDKGPKFLHYEPTITLLNNIEFDHADIYQDLTAIKDEFQRLAELTAGRGGTIVANMGDAQVTDVLQTGSHLVIGFASALLDAEGANKDTEKEVMIGQAAEACMPLWLLTAIETHKDGSQLTIQAPNGESLRFKTTMFGKHNALNALGTLAVLQAYHISQQQPPLLQPKQFFEASLQLDSKTLQRWCDAISSFSGVRRRFELVQHIGGVAIFDDFAHHPTAIAETLKAFRGYHAATQQTGSLRVCFDPRNATMRRNLLQTDLTNSLSLGDAVYVGKVAQDLRIPEGDRMNGHRIARDLNKMGHKARAFDESESLLEAIRTDAAPGDTIVFMSSGSFDQLPRKLAAQILEQQ
jgi:UDP-N-acetylmuramate: L-alanyl-gamma-D-glutamyl-meso-diaminopimelate ligase